MTFEQKQARRRESRQRHRDKNREKHRRYCREYYKKNRLAELKRAAKYREENSDKILDGAKKRYWESPEKYRARHNKWRTKNRETALEATRRWRRENPEAYRIISRKSGLKRRFGITLEDYDRLFKEQKGRCKICKRLGGGVSKYFPLDVDHCHKTGKVRGLLCGLCNRGIGQLEDSPERLRAAAAYLEKA